MATIGKGRMAIRNAVKMRANGSCEGCGEKFPRNRNKHPRTMHHRTPQRMGGVDSIANLLCLCVDCHRAIHQAEEDAAIWGSIAWVVPELTPVRIRNRFWALLANDGSYRFLKEEEAIAAIDHLLTFAAGARALRDPFMRLAA